MESAVFIDLVSRFLFFSRFLFLLQRTRSARFGDRPFVSNGIHDTLFGPLDISSSLSTFELRVLGISIGSYRDGFHPFGSNPRVQQADRTRGNRDRLFRLVWFFSRLIFESFEFVITPFFSSWSTTSSLSYLKGEHSLCRCPHHI